MAGCVWDDPFPNPEAAIKWELDTGAFKDPKHAENTYQKVNRTAKLIDAREMALAWRRAIKRRLEENGKAV